MFYCACSKGPKERFRLKNLKDLATFLLLIVVTSSGISVSLCSKTAHTIGYSGVISCLEVSVTVDPDKVIGENNLSLGFVLGFEWKTWRDSSVLRQLAKDAGFRMIRLFSHQIEPCTLWDETTKTGIFNWTEVDLLMQRIFETGSEPLICLDPCSSNGSITPPGMAVNPVTGLPYPESFAAYCARWVSHFRDIAAPVRFYEVWNEPFFYFYDNWVYNETKLSYFLQFFNACYHAMHDVNDQVLVGNDASLYRKFLDYWRAHGGKLDFFSFHKYDCDGMSMDDETPLLRAEQRYFVSDGIWHGINDARKLWGAKLPAIASECNWAATCENGTDPRIQETIGAAWLALVLRTAILEDVQYNLYFSFSSSKLWELATKSSRGFGFGMVNMDDDQPWYPYYVQKLIGNNLSVGDKIVDSKASNDETRSIAWLHNGMLNILLICKTKETKAIRLEGFEGQLDFSKIDTNNRAIQEGKINAVDSLIASGYTVILLQCPCT